MLYHRYNWGKTTVGPYTDKTTVQALYLIGCGDWKLVGVVRPSELNSTTKGELEKCAQNTSMTNGLLTNRRLPHYSSSTRATVFATERVKETYQGKFVDCTNEKVNLSSKLDKEHVFFCMWLTLFLFYFSSHHQYLLLKCMFWNVFKKWKLYFVFSYKLWQKLSVIVANMKV